MFSLSVFQIEPYVSPFNTYISEILVALKGSIKFKVPFSGLIYDFYHRIKKNYMQSTGLHIQTFTIRVTLVLKLLVFAYWVLF